MRTRKAVVKIEPIAKDEIRDIIVFAYEGFKELVDFSMFKSRIMKANINWSISVKLLENEKLVGVYLLGNTQLDCSLYGKDISNMIGVEGVCIMVKKNKRGLGYGSLLKDYVETLPYDYIWGGHDKKLNNLQHWLKRRDLVCKKFNNYFTIQVLKKNK